MPTAQSRTRVKAYNHDFCCSEQGRRLRLCWGRRDFPHGDLKKPPQGTLGSFASLCFSGLSQTSLQLESPVVFLQTLGKSAPPGQQSHHTASPERLLPNSQGACPGMGHSLRGGLLTGKALAQGVPSQAGKRFQLHRQLCSAHERPAERWGEGCPIKPPHHAAPASPTAHQRGLPAPQGWLGTAALPP